MRRLLAVLFLLNFTTSCHFREAPTENLERAFKGYKLFEESSRNSSLLPINKTRNKNLVLTLKRNAALCIDTLIDSVSYVRLETGSGFLVGRIDRIFFHNDRIIVVDRSKAKGIFIFDLKGKFLNKIQRIGKGPGEYLEITDGAVNFVDNSITILDLRSRRLLFYDLNGEFLNHKRIHFQFNQLAYLPDGNAVFFNYSLPNSHISNIENYNLFVVNKDLKIIHKACTFDYQKELPFRMFGRNHLINVNKEVYFFPRYKDSVLSINSKNKTIEEKYFLDFGSRKIPHEFWERPNNAHFMEFHKKGNTQFFSGDFSATDNAAFFEVRYAGSSNYVFYFLKSRKILSGKYLSCDERNILIFPPPITNFNNSFVSIISPASIEKAKADPTVKKLMKTKSSKLKSLIGSVKETDNPLLMFYSLRDIK